MPRGSPEKGRTGPGGKPPRDPSAPHRRRSQLEHGSQRSAVSQGAGGKAPPGHPSAPAHHEDGGLPQCWPDAASTHLGQGDQARSPLLAAPHLWDPGQQEWGHLGRRQAGNPCKGNGWAHPEPRRRGAISCASTLTLYNEQDRVLRITLLTCPPAAHHRELQPFHDACRCGPGTQKSRVADAARSVRGSGGRGWRPQRPAASAPDTWPGGRAAPLPTSALKYGLRAGLLTARGSGQSNDYRRQTPKKNWHLMPCDLA